MPVDKSQSRVRRMFGEIAPRYELVNHLLSMGIDRYWRWQTVRLVPPQGDAPLLDVCSGTGALVRAYTRRLPPGARIVGADFCHEMLTIGRAKSARQSQSNGRVAFIESDALRLPFPDDQFQIVSVAFGLRNMADADQGLREMVPRLSPRRPRGDSRFFPAAAAADARHLSVVLPPRGSQSGPGRYA